MATQPGRFAVVIQNDSPSGKRHTFFMVDEDETTMLFETRKEACEATRGALWEHKWVWWVVELESDGRTTYTTDE